MEHKADEQGRVQKLDVWYDGQSPRIYFPNGQTPVDWVGENHRKGVKLRRLMSVTMTALDRMQVENDEYVVGSFNSTQWHEVKHVLKSLSLVTGESLELGEWVE